MESAAAGLALTTKPLPQLASISPSHSPAETPSGSNPSLLPPSIWKIVDKSNVRPAVSSLRLCVYYRVNGHDHHFPTAYTLHAGSIRKSKEKLLVVRYLKM